MKFPKIALLAAAASFFAASLSTADAAPRRGHHARGHNAYASAAAPAGASPGEPYGAGESMLRECSRAVENMYDYAWGVQVGDKYRTCMASHGQME